MEYISCLPGLLHILSVPNLNLDLPGHKAYDLSLPNTILLLYCPHRNRSCLGTLAGHVWAGHS